MYLSTWSSRSEFPRKEGRCPGPEALEYLESCPLSYGDGLVMSSAERDRNGDVGGVWWLRGERGSESGALEVPLVLLVMISLMSRRRSAQVLLAWSVWR